MYIYLKSQSKLCSAHFNKYWKSIARVEDIKEVPVTNRDKLMSL